MPVRYDSQGRPCSERVDYTLFKDVSDGNGGGHGEEVCRGVEIIRWNNDEVINEEKEKAVIKNSREESPEHYSSWVQSVSR